MAVITFDTDKVSRSYPGDLDIAYPITLLSSGIAGHSLYQDPASLSDRSRMILGALKMALIFCRGVSSFPG